VTLAAAVAAEVQRRMTARKLSQNALARAAGMPPTLLHRAVNGERDLQLDEVEQLARALGVSVEWLLSAAIRRAPRSGERSESNGSSRQV
jgi:transcriptional regulator with XRE-family HTH domain